MNTRDPFDWLHSVNPVPDSTGLEKPRSDPAAQALLERIREDAGVSLRHRRHVRRFLIPVVAVAAVTTTAAAAWVLSRKADDPTQVACFRADDRDADIVGLAGDGDPISLCREVWETGQLGPSPGPPALQACVLVSGIVGVFPGENDDVCRRLGLNPADLSGDRGAGSIVAVQDRLAERFISECVPFEDAVGIIEGELEDAGLDNWTVVLADARAPERPCASVAFDVATRSITVVPVPVPPGG